MNSRLNCKVGDLAIVINTELPENLGQIVEVVGSQQPGPLFLTDRGHVWHVRAVSGRKTLVYRFNVASRIETHTQGPAPDCCLRPVSGLPDDEVVKTDTLEPEFSVFATPATVEFGVSLHCVTFQQF